MGGVFKELTKPAPKAGSSMPGAGKKYGALKLSSGQIELDKAISRVRSSGLPSKQKKIAEAELLTLGRQNLIGTRVTKAKIAGVGGELKGLIGEPATAEVQRVVERLFEGRSERTGVDIEQEIRMRTRNLHSWQKDAAVILLRGLDQKGKPLRKHNVVFNQDIAQVAGELGGKYGKYSAQKFEKPFYPSKEDDATKGVPESHASQRTVGLREGLLPGWGRRTGDEQNSNNK